MQGNALKAIKIPGLFLRSKFVPTHQYERISKFFAAAKRTTFIKPMSSELPNTPNANPYYSLQKMYAYKILELINF